MHGMDEPDDGLGPMDPSADPARDDPTGKLGGLRRLMGWEPFPDQAVVQVTGATEETFDPAFDVVETDRHLMFLADLPGVSQDDLDLSVEPERLVVQGRRPPEAWIQAHDCFALERRFGPFRRSFALPPGLDLEAVSATLRDGVLAIQIPKRANRLLRVPVGGRPRITWNTLE